VGRAILPPTAVSKTDLVYLTEQELFAPEWNGLQIAAFEGEVVKVDNIVVTFGSEWYNKNYWAIVHIKVGEVYRGDIEPGEVVTVRLYSPVRVTGSEVQSEDSGVASRMTVGTKGIFMPARYDENSIYRENNATLYLQELAQYGMLDGERWAFLDKPDGPLFARYAYEGAGNAKTMDDVRAFVLEMLQGD
jgi:hypothetical protein